MARNAVGRAGHAVAAVERRPGRIERKMRRRTGTDADGASDRGADIGVAAAGAAWPRSAPNSWFVGAVVAGGGRLAKRSG